MMWLQLQKARDRGMHDFTLHTRYLQESETPSFTADDISTMDGR